MTPFGTRLQTSIADRGSLCIGIDPHPQLLHRWGLEDTPNGLERFSRTAVEALADRVAVVKPQSAFFERFGSRGIAVLERVLSEVRAAGALSILDVKRGDIGSTVEAYASAYLDPASSLATDAVTASAYLGFGSLHPLLDAAYKHGAGVFVLALTSNPEGASLQRAVGPDGRTVAQRILDEVADANAAEGAPTGSVGVVVGATLRGHGHRLDHLRGPILAPGLGAQGAAAADLPAVFGAALPAVLPAVSRELLAAGPDPARLRAAAARLAAEVAAVRPTGSGPAGQPAGLRSRDEQPARG